MEEEILRHLIISVSPSQEIKEEPKQKPTELEVKPETELMVEPEKAIELFDVIAYPNPFNNHFEISLQSSDNSKVSVLVYDMVGRLIEDKNVNANEVSTIELEQIIQQEFIMLLCHKAITREVLE